MGPRGAIAGLASGLALAIPAPALADDLYADNTGLFADCTQASPCALSTALGQASSGDTIHVGGGGYGGGLSLPDGISMIKESYPSPQPTNGPATIGADGNASPAITVAAGTAPRSVSGFTVKGGAAVGSATLLAGPGVDNLTVSENTFDDTDDSVLVHLSLNGGSPRVRGNTFSGLDDNILRRAISYAGTGNPEFDGNAIGAYFIGVEITGTAADFATVDIHDNEVTGLYHEGMVVGIGMWLKHADGALTGNLIESAPAQTLVQGIDASSFTATSDTDTPLRASRNQIYGANGGFRISGPNPVELRDEVYGNNDVALTLVGNEDAAVTATGITTQSSDPALFEISLGSAGSSLTLDSSFIGDNGAQHISTAGGTCTGAFSATSEPTSPNCPGIQTGVIPMFAAPSPAANDFHLLPGSPLIDAGDPAAPAAGELDFEGDARAIAIKGCPPRRDIGADERATAALDCTPPETTIGSKPKKKSTKRKASFSFSSSEPGSSFVCKLDARKPVPCSSPFKARKLKPKPKLHRFQVFATDAAGNADPSPATYTWKVKKKKKR